MRLGFLRWARSKRTWVALAVFGLLAVLGGSLLWAEFHLRAAQRALERRAYSEARAHLDCYGHIWPSSPIACLLAIRCAGGSGAFDEADRLISAYRRLGADREPLALEEDLLDAQRGTLSSAGGKTLWNQVEQNHPETPRILEAMAQGCLYTNRLGEAMLCLERWLAYSPGDSQALYLRGLVWEGMGALDKAGEDYRQALRRDPDHLQAGKRLAEYLTYTGEIEDAAALFEQMLKREPQDVALMLGLARCRRLQGKTVEAQQLLDALLARGSSSVPILVERSRVAQNKGDAREAEGWYRQALAEDPFDHDACYGLAQCLRSLGNESEAQDYEAKAARIEMDLKRLSQLVENMGKDPGNLELAYEAGSICLRNGQKAEAKRWFRNVLQGNPNHEGARQGLVQAVQN